MASTNVQAYWNPYSFNKTNPAYRTPLFQKIFSTACINVATVLNANATSSSEFDLENPRAFMSNTGVDDILPVDENTIKTSPSASQSRNKIQMFKAIFRDHLPEIEALNPRSCVLENISRMLNCGDPAKGGFMYACPDCGKHVRFVPVTCGSRFCPSCGHAYNMKRANAMKCKINKDPHRHVVFTIPQELRPFFRAFRESLNDLSAAVSDTLSYIARKVSSSQEYDYGAILAFHTFGRDLKWNPHCHVLLCNNVYGNTKGSQPLFLSYPLLRKSFQRSLLKRLQDRFGTVFSKLSSLLYKTYSNGFYVHAPLQNVNTHSLISYIGRYLGRPPIASSRLDDYDGKDVTFHYTRHEDDKMVSETLPAIDFIKKLIVHIPDKYFKMVRYLGFYSSEGANKPKITKFNMQPKVPPAAKKSTLDALKWQASMIRSFSVDPLLCPLCGATMEPVFFTWEKGTHYYPNFVRSEAVEIHSNHIMKISMSSTKASKHSTA